MERVDKKIARLTLQTMPWILGLLPLGIVATQFDFSITTTFI
jgi:hypothetical protein